MHGKKMTERSDAVHGGQMQSTGGGARRRLCWRRRSGALAERTRDTDAVVAVCARDGGRVTWQVRRAYQCELLN